MEKIFMSCYEGKSMNVRARGLAATGQMTIKSRSKMKCTAFYETWETSDKLVEQVQLLTQ
jgi:hypothetical protein